MQLNGIGKLKWPLVSRLHVSMVDEKYNLNDFRKQHFIRKKSSILLYIFNLEATRILNTLHQSSTTTSV